MRYFTGRLADIDIGLRLTDWSNCLHPRIVEIQAQKSGSPQFRCSLCRKSFTMSPRDGRMVRLTKIGRLFVAGLSVAAAAQATGYKWHTVQDYYARLAAFSGRPIPTGTNAGKTQCPAGHEYTPENTRQYGHGRRCRTCENGRKPKSGKMKIAAAERLAALEPLFRAHLTITEAARQTGYGWRTVKQCYAKFVESA